MEHKNYDRGSGYGSGAGLFSSARAAAEAAGAPFVTKTYCMVNDLATDALIVWGKENNSFVVLDPFGFAQQLLPEHFRHKNFSSFVRQLNTYGFRKVDPDRWEFAHESFLRGETHLLQRIIRRNSGHKTTGGALNHHSASKTVEEEWDDDDEKLLVEVLKLKQEQIAFEEEVQSMLRRVQETERKPKQMMPFVAKVVRNPRLLPGLKQQSSSSPSPSAMTPQDGGDLLAGNNTRKRGRLIISSAPSQGDWLGMVEELLGNEEDDTCVGLESVYTLALDERSRGAETCPFSREDAGVVAVDPVAQFVSLSPFTAEFVGGGGVDMDAATYPFVLPTQ